MDLPAVILVGAIILALASLELCLYAVPIRIRLHVDCAQDRRAAFISARWLCLGIRCTLSRGEQSFSPLLGDVLIPLPASLPGATPGTGGMRDRSPEDRRAHTALSYIHSAVTYLPDLISIARATFRSVSFRRLDCRAVIGLSGPAETGMLYGFFWAVKPLICRNGRTNLELVPDFTKEHIEGRLELDARISRPFNLVARLARLFILFQQNKRRDTESVITP